PPLLQSLEASIDLENTFGAYIICTCLGCIMFGLTTHQTYRYFRLYPTDKIGLKALVRVAPYSLVSQALDVMHTISSVHICYFYLVSNYFHPERLASGVWSIRMIVLEMGLIIVLCHSFYARRLFLLGNRNLIPVIVIVSQEYGMAFASQLFIQVSFAGFAEYSWMVWTILSIAVAVDVVATGTLTYYLHQSRTGFQRTDSMVDILMVYAINTGKPSGFLIVTVSALICSIVMPRNLVYSAILVVGSKMYANSLLAVLNSRRSLLDRGMEGFETGSFGLKVVDPRKLPEELRGGTHAI
ncbi:hypothetical protein BV20DRAFT_903986, partial [Pilatotrama ljubarskyi]